MLAKNPKYIILGVSVFVLSVIISVFFWNASKNYYEKVSSSSFERLVDDDVRLLQKRMMRYKYALISASALINTNNNISKETFSKFINSLDLDTNYPGFQGIGFSPVILKKDLNDFKKYSSSFIENSYTIHPMTQKDIYVPVKYIEPLNERNKVALGFDLYSEQKRKDVLDRARDTGLISTSNKVKLIQEITSDIQAGILMYIPIYNSTDLDSVEKRRESIIGFVSGVFRMNDLMKNLFLDNSIANFEIYDSSEEVEKNLIYKSFKSLDNPKFSLKKEIYVNDKIWYINFYSTKNFEKDFGFDNPLKTTFAAIFLYFILLIILLYILTSKKKLEIKTNELEKAYKDLTCSQNRYKTIVEQSITGIYIFQDNRFLFVNNQFCEMFGYTQEEVLNTLHPTDVVAQVDYLIAKDEIDKRNSGEKRFSHYIVRGIKKDGTLIWIEIFGNSIEIDGIASISGVVLDITEKVEAQKELENIFNFSNIGLAILSTQKQCLETNNQLTNLLGYSEEELIKIDFFNIIHQDDVKMNLELFNKVIKGEIDNYQIESRFIKNDGKILKIIVTLSAYKIDSKIEYLLVSLLDISEAKLKDELLSQQSKLASMGEMIANIAHQWKQPLSLITVCSRGIKLQLEMDQVNKENAVNSLDQIVNATNYLSNTIDDFRDFFKPQNSKIELNVNKLIDKTLKLASSGFKNKSIEVIKNIDDIYIKTFENHLIQVLINIINNAKDALLNTNEKRLIFISGVISDDEKNIIISIKDSAGGIPENIMNRIFEAYFTTKESNIGTGIGLYMSKEIVTKHLNGFIEVSNCEFVYNNQKFKGAEFKIFLPNEK